jgi:hypothetical protein
MILVNKKRFFNHRQRTPAWDEARRGKFTASQAWRLLDEDEAPKYIREVVADRLCKGNKAQGNGYAYRWGVRHEADAIAKVADLLGVRLLQPGFVESRDYPGWFGASPDAVEEAFCFAVEVKALAKDTVRKIRLSDTIPWRHRIQVAAEMLATGVPSMVYAVYHPEEDDLYIRHYTYIDLADDIGALRKALDAAIDEATKLLGGVI